MTGSLGHFEFISNGKHTPDRPRGLHPAIFGTGGSGWSTVAANIVPTLKPGMPVVFHLPGGLEPDGTISDRPFYHAWANDPGSVWTRNLRNDTALAGCLASIRLANAGAPVWFYIGKPRQAVPDGFILDLVQAGLVQGVAFDAIVLQDQAEWLPQIRTYERHGAMIGYEAIPSWKSPEFWKRADWTCFSILAEFQEAQAHHRQFPIHSERPVDERAIVGPIMLMDYYDDVTASRAAQAKGQHVAANLRSPNWTNALAPKPPATTADDDDDGA